MEQVKCFIPETLEEALRIRKETGATVLAGGSDLMVANSMGAGVTPAFKGDVLIIASYARMEFEEAKTFRPWVVFPDTATNRLVE